MKREIVHIDEQKCNGCGACIPNCAEGALQVIDGKARLISDLFCDGLGACIGHCPEDAITIEEREAEAYDERRVIESMVSAGGNVVRAHLEHLQDHGQQGYYDVAVEYLTQNDLGHMLESDSAAPTADAGSGCAAGGCPGSATMQLKTGDEEAVLRAQGPAPSSRLKQWPVQLHLLSPNAPYFQAADLLLCADCVAYSYGDFHEQFLNGRSLAIACPKLDSNKDSYIDKLSLMIDEAKINTLTVLMMEVPCCGGLLYLAQQAAQKASRNVPVKQVFVSLKGEVLSEEWS